MTQLLLLRNKTGELRGKRNLVCARREGCFRAKPLGSDGAGEEGGHGSYNGVLGHYSYVSLFLLVRRGGQVSVIYLAGVGRKYHEIFAHKGYRV